MQTVTVGSQFTDFEGRVYAVSTASSSPPSYEIVSDGLTVTLDSDGKILSVSGTLPEGESEMTDARFYGIGFELDDLPFSILELALKPSVSVLEMGDFRLRLALSGSGVPADFDLSGLQADFASGQMKAEDVMYSVFDAEERLASTIQKNGIFTEYERGKVLKIWDRAGNLLTEYIYDEDGSVVEIRYVQARRDAAEKIAEARLKVELAKMQALFELARQYQAGTEQIEAEYAKAISSLQSQRSSLEAQRYQKVCRKTLCWETCETVEVPGVQDQINQVNQAIDQAIRDRGGALDNLNTQVDEIKADVNREIEAAFTQIDAQEAQMRQDIIRQEATPVVFAWYRKILGRDPDLAEYDYWIGETDFEGALDLEALRTMLLESTEYADRLASVNQIKAGVTAFLNDYVNMTEAEKLSAQAGLGMEGKAVELTREELDKILGWLNSRGLHFGQSAYLALEALLDDAGIGYVQEELARDLILIDILAGIMTPFERGDLLISLYALNKKAQAYGLELSGASLTYEALLQLETDASGNLAGRLIAHINSDHYVIVIKVEEDQITYIDPGMGADHQNQVMALAQSEFLGMWGGTVLLAKSAYDFLQAMPNPPPDARMLSDEEAMRIRGAFFGAIFNFFKKLFVGAFNLIIDTLDVVFDAVVNLVTLRFDDLFKDIKTDLNQIVTDIVEIGEALIGIAAEVLSIIPVIGKPVSRLVKKVSTFILENVEVSARAVIQALPDNLQEALIFFINPVVGIANVLMAGVQASIAHTLNAFGISEETAARIAGFVASGIKIVAGAVLVALTGDASLLASGIADLSVQLGLSPEIAQAVSIASSALIGGAVDGNSSTTVFQALKDSAPKLASSFAMAGAVAAGGSLGLSWRITALIGLPVRATITGLTNGLGLGTGQGGGSPGGIFEAIKDALISRETLAGVLSIGAEFALDQIGAADSVWGSLLSRLSVGLVKDFIQTKGKINIFDSLVNNSQKTLNHFFDPVLLPQLFAAVAENGLSNGFEQYAVSILRRDTIEDFIRGGVSFADQLALALQAPEDADCGGQACKAVHLAKNDKLLTFKYFFNEGEFEIYGIQEISDDIDRRFMFETDADGNIIGVRVQVLDENGQVITERDLTGDVRDSVQFTDFNGDIFAEISVTEDGRFEFANYNLGVSGNISQYGEVDLSFHIPELEEDFGDLIQQFNASNLTAEQKEQIVLFSVGNGFWNQSATKDEIAQLSKNFIQDLSGDLGTFGTPPAILYEDGHIAVDGGGNILTTASLPVTLYEETGLIGNGLRWTCETWFGCNTMKDEIITELTHYMDVLELNGIDPSEMNMVHFAHSGNFQPMIKALEDDRLSGLNLKTLVVFEGPYVGDGVINNTNLDTIIRIHGTADVLDGDAPVPFLDDKVFKGVNADGSERPLTNYNIEILGAKHSDFDRNANPQVNIFMRDLNLIANDDHQLELLLSTTTPGITVENGIVKMDPDKYVSPFGDR